MMYLFSAHGRGVLFCTVAISAGPVVGDGCLDVRSLPPLVALQQALPRQVRVAGTTTGWGESKHNCCYRWHQNKDTIFLGWTVLIHKCFKPAFPIQNLKNNGLVSNKKIIWKTREHWEENTNLKILSLTHIFIRMFGFGRDTCETS